MAFFKGFDSGFVSGRFEAVSELLGNLFTAEIWIEVVPILMGKELLGSWVDEMDGRWVDLIGKLLGNILNAEDLAEIFVVLARKELLGIDGK
ncbi:hypothetical protein DY000_02052680 [Brassica cretica]|uniref:Uncharacterized protein n=1 Tax=Brassica cretica TaxID=69181 RepID=A0ABQ7AFJ7_BRACR|nr:hypothetical protein DY000_02052680 [Brassica cretica]